MLLKTSKGAGTILDMFMLGTEQALDKHILSELKKNKSQQEWLKKQGPTSIKGAGLHIPGWGS